MGTSWIVQLMRTGICFDSQRWFSSQMKPSRIPPLENHPMSVAEQPCRGRHFVQKNLKQAQSSQKTVKYRLYPLFCGFSRFGSNLRPQIFLHTWLKIPGDPNPRKNQHNDSQCVNRHERIPGTDQRLTGL